jgi:hypothetical protein
MSTTKTPIAEERLYSLTKNEQANECFANSVARKGNGQAKDNIREFLWIMDQVSSARSFTFTNVQNAAKAYDLGASELASLFRTWCETMLKFDKLTPVQSVYDEQVWLVIG